MIANIFYMQKNIIHINISYTIRSLLSSILTFGISIVIIGRLVCNVEGYITFFIEAAIVFVIILILNIVLNCIICKKETGYMLGKVKNKVKNKKGK